MLPSLAPWCLEVSVGEPITLIPDGDLCITNACIKDLTSESYATLYMKIETPMAAKPSHTQADETAQIVPLCWLRPASLMSVSLNVVLSQDDSVQFFVKTNSEDQISNTISLFGYYFDAPMYVFAFSLLESLAWLHITHSSNFTLSRTPPYEAPRTPVQGGFLFKNAKTSSPTPVKSSLTRRRDSSSSSSPSPKRRLVSDKIDSTPKHRDGPSSQKRERSASVVEIETRGHAASQYSLASPLVIVKKEPAVIAIGSTTEESTDGTDSTEEVEANFIGADTSTSESDG
ncbi:hypothetical protein SISNIDRAFT_488920 [Sistotremastrum niveocremeum HHB9708]|uniref:Nucleoplasmin-like domain-containing protein n=1 Tax=Sistotremastrum niveocremeum HHB9708 TaxID=1314777 RepID=A0A164QKR3_9AGAM|nr:hypothetical protein SISNIDRAFT_488920 [Sistotremastrum niveocremeum HHB9708]